MWATAHYLAVHPSNQPACGSPLLCLCLVVSPCPSTCLVQAPDQLPEAQEGWRRRRRCWTGWLLLWATRWMGCCQASGMSGNRHSSVVWDPSVCTS